MITTEELAAQGRVKNQTIRRRLCQTGSYFGLVPTKLPNGRLLWPDNSFDILTGAASAETAPAKPARAVKRAAQPERKPSKKGK